MHGLPTLLVALVALAGPADRPAATTAPPPPPAAHDAPATPAEDFERGKTAFGRAEYARAIGILRPLLYPDVRLDSEGEVVQAHRMLGVAHLFEDQPAEARSEFRRLLELRPDYRFDPLLDPARVVEFFNGVLKEEVAELAAVEAKRKKRDADLALRRQQEAERLCRARAPEQVYERHSYLLNFVPFGAGQFQNRQPRKGWAFLGVESALGAVSVGAFSTNFLLFGVRPQRRCLDPATTTDMTGGPQTCQNIDHSDEAFSRKLVQVQVVSGGLFFAAAIWGVIDAIRNFRPLVPVDADASLPTIDAAPTATVKAGAPSALYLLRPQLVPVTAGTGMGLGWSF
jgi:hypothetical protein